MAEIKSFPNNQDEYIGAEHVMKWLHGRTSGVFGAENNLATTVVPDSMSVQISDGVGWMANTNGDGVVFWNDNEQTSGNKLTLTHDVADGALDRIDRIVVTWETTNYVALPTISILKGTASSTPVPPALTNNATQRQISVARVRIPAGTISVSASMITDERLDPDVCGIVTETVRVDTSTMQGQFEALLTAIQRELQNLNAGTAALLKTGDTMQGTLDMGGNEIKNVATPTDDGDAVSKRFLDDALSEQLSMELLWENASPSSDFANQDINLDLTSYTHVLVEFVSADAPVIARKGANFYASRVNVTSTEANSVVVELRRRLVTPSDTKVAFSACNGSNYTTASGKFGATTTYNGNCKPFRIYGMKGVG